MSLGRTLARLDREALVAALEAHNWGIYRTAKTLGMAGETLKSRMKASGITKPRRPRWVRKPQRPVSVAPGTGPRCTFHAWAQVGPHAWVCTRCPAQSHDVGEGRGAGGR